MLFYVHYREPLKALLYTQRRFIETEIKAKKTLSLSLSLSLTHTHTHTRTHTHTHTHTHATSTKVIKNLRHTQNNKTSYSLHCKSDICFTPFTQFERNSPWSKSDAVQNRIIAWIRRNQPCGKKKILQPLFVNNT